MLLYLFKKDININHDNAIHNCCENGHLDTIKYLLSQTNYINLLYVYSVACEYGHLHIIKYIDNHYDININRNYSFYLACENKHIDVIDYLSSSCTNLNNYRIYYNKNKCNDLYKKCIKKYKK